MERRDQLKNIAFGGDWSEQILVRERVNAALSILATAAVESCDTDPCAEDVLVELDYLCGRIARGEHMAASWRKGGAIREQGARRAALDQVLKTIQSGIGKAAFR